MKLKDSEILLDKLIRYNQKFEKFLSQFDNKAKI
jgi:hypothetical protein